MGVDYLEPPGFSGCVLGRRKSLKSAGELIFQYITRLHKRMNRRGKRRRIGKVHGIKILHRRAHGNAGDRDIHHLVYRACSQNLNPQKLMGIPVSNQLGDKSGGIGIIMRFVVRNACYADCIKTGLPGLLLGETGTARVQIPGQFHDACSQTAFINSFVSRQVSGKTASGDIGGRAHGRPLALSGNPVVNLRAVAHSVYVI